MLIRNLNFLEKIGQKFPVLPERVQGGMVRMSMRPHTTSSVMTPSGQIVAFSEMITTLSAQGIGGHQINVIEFESNTGINGDVNAGGTSLVEVSATSPG